ncbi:MAG: RNA polymerase sigma factor [Sarcina sp.]
MEKSKKKFIDESFENSTKLMINTVVFVEFVVESYSDMLVRIVYQNLGTMLEAEDMVQEVFIKLIREKSFSSEKHLKNWLIKVTINLCRNRKRSSCTRKE